MGLSLEFQFYFIDLYVYFIARPGLSDYCKFCTKFWKRLRYELSKFFFFKIVLVILGLLSFQTNFQINLSISTKNPAEILLQIVLNLQTISIGKNIIKIK